MSRRARQVMFFTSAAAFCLLLTGAFLGLPAFGTHVGDYARLIGLVAMQERHITNITTSIVFDYRGFDTMGEEYIIFASVAALALLLRKEGSEKTSPPGGKGGTHSAPRPGEAVQWLGSAWLVFTMVFGVYIVIHGQLTPGGGFHGGTILGTAFFAIFLIYAGGPFRRFESDSVIDAAGAAGAGLYVLVGLAGIAAGGQFLQNILPLGRTGDLLSGGTIAVINAGVGLEVASAFALLSSLFVRETGAYGRRRPA